MGVHLSGGKYKRTLSPGFWWKWPLYDSILTIAIKDQVINLPNQSVATKDNKALAVSGVIRYRVIDPRLTLLEVQAYDPSLQNLAMGVIANYVALMPRSECTYDNICGEVLEEITEEAEKWGIDILDFKLTDLVEHRAIRLITADMPAL